MRSNVPARRDAALAAAVTAAMMLPALLPHRAPWWMLALVLGASAPILWLRTAFVPVALAVGTATTVLVIEQDALPYQPAFFMPFGALVCTYALAALTTVPRPAWRAAGIVVLACGVVFSLVVPHESTETFRAVITEFVAAYALGVGTRARQAQRAADDERNLRLEEARSTAVERERTRIARDMHDILTHSVGLMIVQAEAGRLTVRSDPGRAEGVFEAVADLGREAVGQLKVILGALRGTEPSRAAKESAEMPGMDALPGLIDRTRRVGVAVTIAQAGRSRPLPPDAGVAAYRIVQESLTNALRHSAARAIGVRLAWSDTALTVQVTDDGGGTPEFRAGHGITGMRERAEACGGTLDVDPTGFAVTATLPIG